MRSGGTHQYRQGPIHCESRVTNGYEAPSGQFDLVVVTSSWDERALVVTTKEIDVETAVVMKFENKGTSGRRDRHDAALAEWATRNASAVKYVDGSSEQILEMWRQLRRVVESCWADARRPLRVMFDLSTCPRYLALATLQACIGSGVASELVYTYAEAQYPEEGQRIDRYEMFTSGRWETLAVPGLVGRYDPSRATHYVVAVGFEGSKTRRVIARADPDRVTVLFPDPAVAVGYVERTKRNNAPMFEEWGIGEDDLIRAGAADTVGAWRALATTTLIEQRANQFLLCAGTKPHALAMGLLALVSGDPAVLYVKPASHREVDISASGTYWRYVIRDVTVAPPVAGID